MPNPLEASSVLFSFNTFANSGNVRFTAVAASRMPSNPFVNSAPLLLIELNELNAFSISAVSVGNTF